MAKLAYNHLVQFIDGNGDPYAGAQLFTYAAGSSTKATTYQDSGSSTANANPIELDANGRIPAAIWLTEGVSYKFVLAPSDDTDPPVSPLMTLDEITGINDASVSLEQWSESGMTPTYVSATQFTVAGDQTSTLHKGRRLKITDAGGTKYATITETAYTTLTTVTVAGDSLATPVSAVSVSIITAIDPSISADMVHRKAANVASATSTDIWGVEGDLVHITGTTTIEDFDTAPYAGAERTIIFDDALTLTHGANLDLPGDANITTVAGDRAVVRADSTTAHVVTSYTRAGQNTKANAAIATGRNITASRASATTVDIDADELVLKDSSGNYFTAESVNLTVAITSSGANGLDTGTEAGDTWYYGWVIAKADGTVAGLLSTSATSPTLPSGYTFKALATAVRNNGSSNFIEYRQRGNEVFYEAGQAALANGNNTLETEQSVASYIPTIALSFNLLLAARLTTDASGPASTIINLGYISAATFASFGLQVPVASQGAYDSCSFCLPNISQRFYYSFSDSGTNIATRELDGTVLGFKLPMGGE